MLKEIPEILINRAEILEKRYQKVCPELAPLVKQCFLNTIETTVKKLEDESYFVITGDIPAMWLRDSAAQIRPYIKYASHNQMLSEIIEGIINKQVNQISIDSYANAFNETANGTGHKDKTLQNDFVWERKFEVDSLCAPLYLSYLYWKETGRSSFFTQEYLNMIEKILDVFTQEQKHESSPYAFERFNCVETDTLPCQGKGNPVAYTGMIWSGFRPSDDRCVYGYLIPANIMAVVALNYAREICDHIYKNTCISERCQNLAVQIREGIENYGIVKHEVFGEIYAYETDGRGNYLLMDDANSPSLLSIPYLGYQGNKKEIYQNTRAFVLSKENPYYYEGKYAGGIGSPHTPKGYIWHIGMIMRALTSVDRAEILQSLTMLSQTHAGTNYMHESFDPENPEEYTRPWFAWANSLFSELLDQLDTTGFWEKQ